jgi:hypothetical protein
MFTQASIGTSATIWGVQTTSILGVLSAMYTVDGVPIGEDYSVQSSNSGYKSGEGQVPNNALFTTGSLPQGNHTIMQTINKCVNQTFIFDYITYMPLGLPNSTSIDSGSSGIKAPVGAVVGGVLGGIALLLVALAVIFLRRQRQRRGALSEKTVIVPPGEASHLRNAAPSSQAIHPFVVPLSPSEHNFPRSQSPSDLVSTIKPSLRTYRYQVPQWPHDAQRWCLHHAFSQASGFRFAFCSFQLSCWQLDVRRWRCIRGE